MIQTSPFEINWPFAQELRGLIALENQGKSRPCFTQIGIILCNINLALKHWKNVREENQKWTNLSKISCPSYLVWSPSCKVSVQGVVALGGHFATLCQKLDFHEAFFVFSINFQKDKGNILTLLIILIMKSLQIELHSTNLLLWPTICKNKRAIPPKYNNS